MSLLLYVKLLPSATPVVKRVCIHTFVPTVMLNASFVPYVNTCNALVKVHKQLVPRNASADKFQRQQYLLFIYLTPLAYEQNIKSRCI